MKNVNCNCNCDLKDLLYFDHLIMPRILTFIYWVVLGIVVLTGLSTMFMAGFFSGLMAIVTGLIFTRIIFEMIIVVFTINKNLEKLVSLNGGAASSLNNNEFQSTQKEELEKTKPRKEEPDC